VFVLELGLLEEELDMILCEAEAATQERARFLAAPGFGIVAVAISETETLSGDGSDAGPLNGSDVAKGMGLGLGL
jgi:hypothetical protein